MFSKLLLTYLVNVDKLEPTSDKTVSDTLVIKNGLIWARKGQVCEIQALVNWTELTSID